MINTNLQKILTKHEGLKLFPYVDTVGKLTIGIGHNLTDNGITANQAYSILNDDVVIATNALNKIFPEFNSYAPARQYALISMMFMGESRFKGFQQMIEAISTGNWQIASEQALASKWASQVKERAIEIAHALKTGELSSFNLGLL